MSVIKCKTILSADRGVFGYNIAKRLPNGSEAWKDTYVSGFRTLQQESDGFSLYARQTGGAEGVPHSCAVWRSPRGRLIGDDWWSIWYGQPMREASCYQMWFAGDRYSPSIPSAVASLPEGNFNTGSPGKPEYIDMADLEHYSGNARCWRKWLSEKWHLWAENVVLRTSNGQRVFDFSNAAKEWRKATPDGDLAEVPSHRPFVWPAGPSENPSILAGYKQDMDPPYGSQTEKVDGKIIAYTYWDDSVSPAIQRYWFWKLTITGYPNIEVAGLPEHIFQYSSHNIPPDGTAFDLNLVFEMWNYSIIKAVRYVRDSHANPRPPPTTIYEYDIREEVVSSDYMDTMVSGTLVQLVPVAPKVRAASGS